MLRLPEVVRVSLENSQLLDHVNFEPEVAPSALRRATSLFGFGGREAVNFRVDMGRRFGWRPNEASPVMPSNFTCQ